MTDNIPEDNGAYSDYLPGDEQNISYEEAARILVDNVYGFKSLIVAAQALLIAEQIVANVRHTSTMEETRELIKSVSANYFAMTESWGYEQ